jgi:hypothetical protein
MKKITYSLFGFENRNSENAFEYYSYLRGLYWNVKMNRLIYPDLVSHLEVDRYMYEEFYSLFNYLKDNFKFTITIHEEQEPLCAAMMWRMREIYNDEVTHVLCRDTDAITTYREAKLVQEWINSGLGFHAINDNPAHGGLMGGMVGFNTKRFKELMPYSTCDQLMESDLLDFSRRGSDQDFLNKNIHPEIKGELYIHNISGAGCSAKIQSKEVPNIAIPNVDVRLWESDLTCRHIGSAGVVEMELLRFFKRFDDKNDTHKEIEKKYPKIFYWHE